MKLDTKTVLIMGWLTPLLCNLAIAQQSASPSALSLSSIVQGMEKVQSEGRPQTPYQVIREYHLFGARSSNANAEVVAQVDFEPPTSKDYSIQKWSGSTRGKQIVQRVLDHEMEASKSNQARNALTSDNYDLTLVGETFLDGRPCYVLGLRPKRKEKDLVSGSAWVDKRSFLIVHLEGEAAKPPSWWLKKVHVKMMFDYVGGTWLQTSTEAAADVRVFGNQTLTAEIVEFRNTDVAAKTQPGVPSSR